jgi:phage-related protein
MAKQRPTEPQDEPAPRPLLWLHGEIKTPPFAEEARREAGYLLRMLQLREKLKLPQPEPLPTVGPRCGALRIRDDKHSWRIMYRLDADAVLIVEVYAKKTAKIPDAVIARCKKRLKDYDDAVRTAQAKKDKGGMTDGR